MKPELIKIYNDFNPPPWLDSP